MNKGYLSICVFCMLGLFFSATGFAESTGEAVFSKSPIDDPSDPGKSVTSFETGDYIYAVLRPGKSWKDIYQKESFYILVDFYVDGEKATGGMVTFKSAEVIARDYLILDIAPKASKMTSYSNPDIGFDMYQGEKYGPEKFTKILGNLTPGKHTIEVGVVNYGDVYSAGAFEIEGSDYKFYSKLNTEIKENIGQNMTLPPAGMVNSKLESEMRQLAENGGWKKIETLFIKDKDWWVEQGVGRHMATIIVAQADDGSYFYSQVTFKQDAVLTGWGPLRIDRTGVKIPILKKNIGKSSGVESSGDSSSPFILFRLALAFTLLIASMILLIKILQQFQDKIGTVLQPLLKIKTLIGVITFGLGAAFFVKNLLVLSPLADILPQAVAILAGLYLGLDLLLKKPAAPEQSQQQDTTANKAGGAAKAGVEKAQDFLAGKRSLIEQLKAYEAPLGAAALVFGLLHLIAGGVTLL